jgi:hypothetical protein
MRQRPELRDLRSLERRRLRSVFPPLDDRERLPRELMLEGERQRRFERRRYLRAAGVLYLPLLVLVVIVLMSLGVKPVIAFGVAGALLAGVYVYTLAVPNR